ncbi:MAG TPA: sigma-70 family RNA polymerase sigma factor [Candidatus Binataceae bacterium]|jgi:RNA polymerase sigma-70 factor (ECF subfamily)|nr:sigma-70 family RNA polymerase sigma factor [Candidatus Binataceae bacterium]
MAGEPASKRARKDAPERPLIEAAQRDPACFAQLYENNFERVYAFIVRRVHDRDQAQDLTADVFHTALKNLSRFEWRGVPFAAWLFRIAANAIADHGKRTARLEVIKMPETSALEPLSGADLAEVEHRARLFKLVERLPDDQRRVITMRFAHQKSIAEIAKDMGRSEGAVKQLQFRSLKSLRAMVDEDETNT